MPIGTLVRIIAKNPSTIALVFGGLMVIAGNAAGWVFVVIGVGLNVLWLRR
jgi:hypothetical protein